MSGHPQYTAIRMITSYPRMRLLADTLLLFLFSGITLSAIIVKRDAGDAGDAGDEGTGDSRPVLAMDNGVLTEDEIEIILKQQKATDKHADGKELEIMEKQEMCAELKDINHKAEDGAEQGQTAQKERMGEAPEITELNKHCFPQTDSDGSSGRKKRSYLKSNSGKWTKCIVPYIIDYSSIPEDKVQSVESNVRTAQKHYETYTGFRFVPYTQDNSDYGLDHSEYLKFVHDSGSCWSHVGRNNFQSEGQKISACGGITALHEIGHALGMEHEQQNPNSFSWLRINYDSIKSNYLKWYLRSAIKYLWQSNATYDIGSLMHYHLTAFNLNGEQTMTTYDKDLFEILESTSNSFYVFRDIQIYHNCFAEFDPCPESLVCHNDGYKSIIKGKCQCRCPPGFESSTNCTTFGYSDMLWPGEKYTILKTQTAGCPEGFEEGRMVHWAYSTVDGSSTYHHSPAITSGSNMLAHDVCTKTNDWSSEYSFPKGKYCIHRYGGTCPDGFTEGLRQTYGVAKPADATIDNSGTLPDGEHGQLFEYLFCCRQDGWSSTPRDFLISEPFILYSIGTACQNIIGMTKYPLEFYTFENDPGYTGLNISGFIAGTTSTTNPSFNVNFCYYEPHNMDCGTMKTFSESETSFTFTSPNYPNLAGEGYRCMWHFTSPPGSTMQLDFEDFNIPYKRRGYPFCRENDFIEIKFIRPGAPGIKFCAETYRKTTWTTENFLTIIYNTGGAVGRGFKATVTVLKDADRCYAGDGSDGSYAGSVSYAKSFDQCIPWWKVTNCTYHQFESRVMDADLTGKECRNVGVGRSPWCYTNAETCEMQTCDACMSGACFDLSTSCADAIAADSTHCDTDAGKAECMETCGLCAGHVKKLRATCGPPSAVQDIEPTSSKTTYDVGETVTYVCPTQPALKKTRVCTSEGTWSNLNFVCGSCPSGFSVVNKRCFKWLGYKTYLSYPDAEARCAEYGANIIKVDSQEIQDWVFKILDYDRQENGLNAWLGMRADSSKTWRWADGSELGPYTNWRTGQPGSKTCAIMRASDGLWIDSYCNNYVRNVVCEFPLEGTDSAAEDQISNCNDVLINTPDLCTKRVDYSWHNCRKTCGL